ncbi:hypothetical protein BH10BDE1_BH10BDE1_21150 [soil metagenome]
MKSFMPLVIAVLSVFLITACGKTSSEKAKDNADSAIAEMKSSATEIQSMGTPTASWSDEKLNRYEALITSCESSANRIEAQDGKDGVIVYGTWSLPQLRSALSTLRSSVRSARAEKANAESIRKETTTLDVARAKYQRHLDAIRVAGTPSTDWSFEQLDQYDAELNGIESTARELMTLTGRNSSTTETLLKSAKDLHETVQAIRISKGAKPAA